MMRLKNYMLVAAAAVMIGSTVVPMAANASQTGTEAAALLAQLEKTYTEEERTAAFEKSLRFDQYIKGIFTRADMTVKESYLSELQLEVREGTPEAPLIAFLEQGLSQMGADIRLTEVEDKTVKPESGYAVTVRYYVALVNYEGDNRGLTVTLYREESGAYTINIRLHRGVVVPSNQEKLAEFIRQQFTSAEIRETESGLGYLNVKIDGGEGAEEKMKAFCTSAMQAMEVIDLHYPNPFMAPDGNLHADPAGTWVMNAEGYFMYDHTKRTIVARIERSPEDGAFVIKINYETGPISVNMEFMEQLFVTDYLKLHPVSSCLAEPGLLILVCEEQDRDAGLAKINEVFAGLGAHPGEYMGSGPNMEYLVYGSENRVISCFDYELDGKRCFDIRY